MLRRGKREGGDGNRAVGAGGRGPRATGNGQRATGYGRRRPRPEVPGAGRFAARKAKGGARRRDSTRPAKHTGAMHHDSGCFSPLRAEPAAQWIGWRTFGPRPHASSAQRAREGPQHRPPSRSCPAQQAALPPRPSMARRWLGSRDTDKRVALRRSRARMRAHPLRPPRCARGARDSQAPTHAPSAATSQEGSRTRRRGGRGRGGGDGSWVAGTLTDVGRRRAPRVVPFEVDPFE